jgi:8-hydroxy-5-deazaflavin:NADPH oxidoreductase
MNIGILGAGKVGMAIARTAIRAGHTVSIAGSGSPDDIALLVQVLAPGATARTSLETVTGSDIVVLSIPSPKYRTLDAALLAGRIVIDAMNYWPDTDGVVADFEGDASSSEVIAGHLKGTRLVKTLNHIGYHDLETDGIAAGAASRRALAVVSDDVDAARTVAGLIETFGYDPVIASPLRAGAALQPGTVIFSGPLTANQVAAALIAEGADVASTPAHSG